MKRLGLIALAFYAAHAVDLLLLHPPAVLLWSCDVAALLVPIALFAGVARLNAAGGIVLLAGLPLWLLDLATGGEFRPTSPLIHVGTAVVAILGMRRLGVPRGSGIAGAGIIAAATIAARVAGSVAENVNLSQRVPPGWEESFPSHGVYLAALGSAMAATAIALEAVLRRLMWPSRTRA